MIDTRSSGLSTLPARRVPVFADAGMVQAAAGLLHGHAIADRRLGVTLLGVGPELRPDGSVSHVWRKTVELWGDPRGDAPRDTLRGEGVEFRIEVSPGTIAFRRRSAVRADRHVEVEVLRRDGADGTRTPALPLERRGKARITSWSPKSRARMRRVIAELDHTPLRAPGVGRLGMVTLTMPGGHLPHCVTEGCRGCAWLAYVPTAAHAHALLRLLQKRYERAWGRKLRAVWKREFQWRGAPHWHLLQAVPAGMAAAVRGGELLGFRDWLAVTWADVVASSEPVRGSDLAAALRPAHELAGTAVDFTKAARGGTDPRMIAHYFAKHGSFAAKEYQNEAPAEWVEDGAVGRFWGVWHLDRAVAAVEVAPTEYDAGRRALRRHSRAAGIVVQVPAWRSRTRVDLDTGEVVQNFRRVVKRRRLIRLGGESGFATYRDAPAVLSALTRYLDQVGGRSRPRTGLAWARERGPLP